MVAYLRITTNNLNSFMTISNIDVSSKEAFFLMRAIQSIWIDNVDRFFQRSNLYYPKKPKSKSHVGISEVFHCEVRKDKIVGVINTSGASYVKVLIFGASPGRGAFVPSMGVRTSKGIWGGIPTLYWAAWQSFFQREVFLLLSQYGFDTTRRRVSHRRKRSQLQSVRKREITRMRNNVRGVFIGRI